MFSAVQDYVKAIYALQSGGADATRVATNDIALHLGVTPASVSAMVRRLAEMRLIEYEKYQGVCLTEPGRKLALEMIRHHRLVELYLFQALGVPWDRVHDEAEKWEHVLSEDLEERMDAQLGHPTRDPHGAPIPSRDLELQPHAGINLTQATVGSTVCIEEVSDHSAELLRYLGERGLYPQTIWQVSAREPFGGPVTLTRHGQSVHLGQQAEQSIWITSTESM